MTDEELVHIATDFREGMLDGEPSAMMCAMVCWPLAGLLACYGVEAEAVEGDLGHINHIWLKLPDGRALDPTADQFNDMFPKMNLPPVYLGPPLEIHQEPHP